MMQKSSEHKVFQKVATGHHGLILYLRAHSVDLTDSWVQTNPAEEASDRQYCISFSSDLQEPGVAPLKTGGLQWYKPSSSGN